MALRSDILSQIQQQQNILNTANAEILTIHNILSGTPGTDVSGNATVTYNGTTYVLSNLQSQLSAYSQQVSSATSQQLSLQSQLSLASTTDTPIGAYGTGTSQQLDNGTYGQTVLRDYQHAKKIFVDGNFRLSPKYGFLFYVEFDFNPLITNLSNTTAQEMGMVVKTVSLPKYTIQVKEHNAYNRKNYVQNKITYEPVNITFHDDQADNVRNFWYDYYSYYYRDPDYADATYQAYTKYQSRPSFNWGYTPRPAVGYNNSLGQQPYQYIQNIRIYSMYQGQFDEYNLVNPIITSFKHGDHAQGNDNPTLEHGMTVQFETVKYLTGYVTDDTVGGFITLNYDKTPSPNGGTPNYQTASTTTTDLANNNTAINPQLQSTMALQTTNQSTAVSYALGGATNASATTGTNAGGYAIPSLGSLTQGLTNGALIQQQLGAVGASLAGQTASSLANGIVGNVSSALGTNGQSIIGLAAAAIANPSAALKTVENMATSLALGIAVNYAQQYVLGPSVNSINNVIGQGITSASNFIKDATGTAITYTDPASQTSYTVTPSGAMTITASDGTVTNLPSGSADYAAFNTAVNNTNAQAIAVANGGVFTPGLVGTSAPIVDYSTPYVPTVSVPAGDAPIVTDPTQQ